MEQAPVQDCGDDPAFDVPPEHIVQSSSGKGWQGMDVAEIVHPLDDFALPALPRHILIINLSPPATIQERLAGRQGRLGTGNLVILPAGAPTTWHVEREGEVRHLHLYLSPSLIHKIAISADIDPDTVEFAETLGVFDSQIETIALSLLAELRSEGLGAICYINRQKFTKIYLQRDTQVRTRAWIVCLRDQGKVEGGDQHRAGGRLWRRL